MDEQVQITVTENGPYVVSGAVPLTEMAPVPTFNGEPIAWHTVRDLPAAAEPLELCRCGQSADRPLCDGSHESATFDGAETADRRPFAERARVDAAPAGAIATVS